MAKETKSATVKVAFLNNPKEGKTMYNIKTPEGDFYGVRPQMVSIFQQGAQYDVKYSESVFNGRTYKTIEEAKQVGAPPAPAAGGSRAPVASDDKTAERIFVCGALNATLSNPTFPAAAVSAHTYIGIVKNLRQAWLETFGGKPSLATEMDEPEIQ